MRSNNSVINIHKKSNSKSEVVSQILYGDTFGKIKKTGRWIKIKNDSDHYKGFIKNRFFPSNHKNNHKIYNIKASLYSKPSIKNKIKIKLSFGSKIRVTKKKNNYYKFDNWWINKKDLKKIEHKTKEPFAYIKRFINAKYKWGGKHYTGIDCSGIIQLCLNYNNKFCPRDSKDQIKFFKKKIKLRNIKKNDLIFWKGHVAVAISKHKLIHAYGPFKKTIRMPIQKTVERILNTANLKVIGVRRI